MAWNEPGGDGKNQDPWGGGNRGGRNGGGGDNQGPPDLDEALRKLQEKMNSIFGGGKRGGGSSGSSGFSGGFAIILLVVVALVWAGSGFYTVNEQERVVVLRLGKYHDTVMPGLRWNPPLIDARYPINVTRVQSKDHRGLMLTEDENIVEIGLKVQYKITNPEDYVLRVRDPDSSLGHAIESALRHVVGTSEMHFLLTEGRAVLGAAVQARVQEYMDDYGTGLLISKVNIESSEAPKQVQAAFDDVIKAREDEQRVKNEADTYSNGVIPEARGRAQRLLEEANAYREEVVARAVGETSRFLALLSEYQKAPEVTRERMYLDAVESVMSRTNKVLVDVEGGNNMLYLPLDRLTGGRTTTGGEQLMPSGVSSGTVDEVANEVIRRLRAQTSRKEAR